MSKVAERFITLGTRGNILGWTTASPEHELLPNQIGLSLEEFKLIEACRGDLEKAKHIIKGLEIKIKKGGRLNGKQKENA